LVDAADKLDLMTKIIITITIRARPSSLKTFAV
jgi:hypothetical protein